MARNTHSKALAIALGASMGAVGILTVAPSIANAWSATQSVKLVCVDNKVVASGEFKNTESKSPAGDMMVTFKVLNKSDGPTLVKATKSGTFTVNTGVTSVNAGTAKFDLTWVNQKGTDSRTVDYKGLDCTKKPSPTPTKTTETPTPTPTKTTESPTPTVTVTTPKPTVTTTEPTPGTTVSYNNRVCTAFTVKTNVIKEIQIVATATVNGVPLATPTYGTADGFDTATFAVQQDGAFTAVVTVTAENADPVTEKISVPAASGCSTSTPTTPVVNPPVVNPPVVNPPATKATAETLTTSHPGK